MAPSLKRTGSIALDTLTWLIAALGILSVLTWAVSLFFGISIVLFATNSMSPSIPQGSAALAIQIPASEVQVGDVVTINRDATGELPITHRVVEINQPITDDTTDDQARELVLKGDNNESVDATIYQVNEVSRVFFALPGFAPVFMIMSDLRILIALGIVVVGLMARAFWKPNTESQPIEGEDVVAHRDETVPPRHSASPRHLTGVN